MQRTMKKTALTVIAILVFSFGVSAQKSDLVLDSGVEKHKGIDAIYVAFAKGYRTLKPEIVANLYTEDAAYLSPGSQIRYGREPILESFSGFFSGVKDSGRSMTIRFHIYQRKVTDALGYDVGVYTLKYFKDGEMLSEHKGKFVVVAIKGKDGSWKFQVDGYSDIKPPQKS